MLGYRLERRLATGDWLFVSPRIIPAQDDGRPNDYRFEETGVPPAVSLRYRLSAVDLHGQTTVLAETAVQPGLHLDLDVRPDGVTVALHGVEGAPATLEMTADLAHGPWTTLGTIEFGPLGVGIATLPTPPTEPHRFFRARFAPP